MSTPAVTLTSGTCTYTFLFRQKKNVQKVTTNIVQVR